jgi:hypothetical protein
LRSVDEKADTRASPRSPDRCGEHRNLRFGAFVMGVWYHQPPAAVSLAHSSSETASSRPGSVSAKLPMISPLASLGGAAFCASVPSCQALGPIPLFSDHGAERGYQPSSIGAALFLSVEAEATVGLRHRQPEESRSRMLGPIVAVYDLRAQSALRGGELIRRTDDRAQLVECLGIECHDLSPADGSSLCGVPGRGHVAASPGVH